jgi:hypothetical protein
VNMEGLFCLRFSFLNAGVPPTSTGRQGGGSERSGQAPRKTGRRDRMPSLAGPKGPGPSDLLGPGPVGPRTPTMSLRTKC